ncbi:MAG TPA: hypothetical protein VIO39_00155, partial [Methylotenera sp.]
PTTTLLTSVSKVSARLRQSASCASLIEISRVFMKWLKLSKMHSKRFFPRGKQICIPLMQIYSNLHQKVIKTPISCE